jgi:hypothetical protein
VGGSTASHQNRRAPALRCNLPIALGKTRKLGKRPATRIDAARMLKRSLKDAGLSKAFSPYSFRATGITNFLENGGTLEVAQRASPLSTVRQRLQCYLFRFQCQREPGYSSTHQLDSLLGGKVVMRGSRAHELLHIVSEQKISAQARKYSLLLRVRSLFLVKAPEPLEHWPQQNRIAKNPELYSPGRECSWPLRGQHLSPAIHGNRLFECGPCTVILKASERDFTLVHVIFSTKDRRPFLQSTEVRSHAHAYLSGTLRWKKTNIPHPPFRTKESS